MAQFTWTLVVVVGFNTASGIKVLSTTIEMIIPLEKAVTIPQAA